MLSVDLDIYQTAAMGALALALGLVLVRKSKTLRRFCIPAAVVGGPCQLPAPQRGHS